MGRLLSELIVGVPVAHLIGDDVEIFDMTIDSREARPLSLFCAVVGKNFDGHDYVEQALTRGAAAILVSRPIDVSVPQIVVPSVRVAVGLVAAALFNNPSHDLDLVGVTGTNGKTTVSYLVEAVLAGAGRRAGLIGTIETKDGGGKRESAHTTPEGPDLQRTLASMRERGLDSVVMEVSSHGLDLHRVDGSRFAVGVFTNLAPEHLDFHGTMEQYFYSKSLLFVEERTRRAVVGTSSPWGKRLVQQLDIPCLTYGQERGCDLIISRLSLDRESTSFTLSGITKARTVRVPVPGIFSAENAAAAFGVGLWLGIDEDEIAAGIESASHISGRFEFVDEGQDFSVIVDYAHTPEAIAALIQAARAITPGTRVILVMGARGNRDRAKRPDLAHAASKADVTIFTTDNPGDEKPTFTLAQLLAGTLDVAHNKLIVKVERREAIGIALDEAQPGDTVLIVGRGHERTIHVGGRELPFDDREVARQCLSLREPRSAGVSKE